MEPKEQMRRERCCVIVPTYNNGHTIIDVLRRIEPFAHYIIVVNDGSTDDTMQLLGEAPVEGLSVVSYEHNRGKGHALMKGFERALQQGFDYAITIDSDGQHYPEDIPLLLAAHDEQREALVVGCRNLTEENMPRQNTFANRFSNFWFRLQTGVKLGDTQSGYRLYPLRRLSMRWWITPRYEAELELLVYSAWHGTPIASTPVRVYYPPEGERVSHFRPFRDFARISVLNTCLCVGAVVYYLPLKLKRALFG